MPPQREQEVVKTLREAMRRIRSLEDNARALEAKLESIENNTLQKTERFQERSEELDEALKDLNTKFLKLENEVSNIKQYLSKVATKAELEELENYADLFSPMKTEYVTADEVEDMIEEATGD